jgi:hypothetical protein
MGTRWRCEYEVHSVNVAVAALYRIDRNRQISLVHMPANNLSNSSSLEKAKTGKAKTGIGSELGFTRGFRPLSRHQQSLTNEKSEPSGNPGPMLVWIPAAA